VPRVEHIDHFARHQAEVSDILRNLHVGQLVVQAVKAERGPPLQIGVRAAVRAAREDDVIAFAPFFYQPRNDLWRILEIGIEGNDDVAARFRKRRGHGGFLAKVAR
jgi:hypothetical protein